MLGFYLFMLPRIGKDYLEIDIFKRSIALLNLTAISMALATFTGRFVYPLVVVSRRAWILALAPWPVTRIVTGKLVFAIVVGLPVATGLVYFSGHQLELSDHAIAYQCLITACMAAGSVGHGPGGRCPVWLIIAKIIRRNWPVVMVAQSI